MGNRGGKKLAPKRAGLGKKTSIWLLAASLVVGAPAGMAGEASKAYADAAITAIGGAGSVTINGAPGLMIELFRAPNSVVDFHTFAAEESSYTFTGLAPGTYFAMLTDGGAMEYGASNTVTVAPSAVTASVGVESIVVSGAMTGATIKLYAADGTMVDSETLGGAETGHTFTNVPPAWGYYATQTVSGIESPGSAGAPSRPPAVTAASGIGYVDVSGAYASAALTLYRTDGTVAATHTLGASEQAYQFSGVAGTFYVVQTVNGVAGMETSFITATPPLLALTGGKQTVTVTNPMAGATLQLYVGAGTPVGAPYTVGAGETEHVFSNVPPGTNYYAVETVNGIVNGGSNLVTVAPGAVTVSGGTGEVAVTGASSGALLKLYRADGTEAVSYQLGASETAYTFTGVVAGINYYAKQTINGVESDISSLVTVAPEGVAATGGLGQVSVTGATSGALLNLYSADGTEVVSYTLGAGETAYTFLHVAPGTNYYVTQTISGAEGDRSSLVTVAPEGVAATGGVGQAAVTGATSGALLKLYRADGTEVVSYPLGASETAYTFLSVAPGTDYYVTQTISGAESAASNLVTVAPPAGVAATGGVGQVGVTDAASGATLKLYSADGTEVDSYPLGAGETAYTFPSVAPGANYYVTQTIRGAESAASNLVTVAPPAAEARGAAGSIEVIGATVGAHLKLYDAGNRVIDEQTLAGAETTYTFEGVLPGLGYYVTQTVGGVESLNTNTVTSSPAAVISDGGAGSVAVSGAAPGAVLTLYAADGKSAQPSYSLTGTDTTHTFEGLTPGMNYYVVQTVGGADSIASNLVSVEPEAPGIRGGMRQIEVNGATPGATLTLYREDRTAAAAYALGGTETSHAFSEANTGEDYFVSQTVNGVESDWAGPVRSYEPSSAAQNTVPADSFDVLVNGKTQSIGAVKKSARGEQKAFTVTVDAKKLMDKLASEGANAVITIPFGADADIAAGELSGQLLKDLTGRQASIVVRTPDGSYSLPARLIDIDGIAKQLNAAAPDAVTIRIEIAKPDAAAALAARSAASLKGLTLAAPPLIFTVTATAGGQTIEIGKLGGYTERAFALPNGVDPSLVATGVAIDANGAVRHVPTRIATIDGKAYAIVSSMSNGVYALVGHAVDFRDVAGHWAMQAINDMGARLVIEGNADGTFSPNRSITRGEFAAILIRALGLKPEGEASRFPDVKDSDGFNDAIRTAVSYGLISGFEDGTFRPEAPITREQTMAILAKAMQITGLSTGLKGDGAGRGLSPFKDAGDAAGWAREAIADCLEAGLVRGASATRLAPKSAITRAETAIIVQRLLQRSGLI